MTVLFLIIVVLLVLADFLWIGLIAKPLYKAAMGPLLSPTVVWWAAGAFYLLYAAAICYFVLIPALKEHSLRQAIARGAFLGLVAFATYDLTNIATTTGWPVGIALLDMAYGTIAGAIVSGASYWIATGVLGM